MERYNFNKNIKIHTICSSDDIRENIQCIYFHEGNAFATDGHIMITADMKEISNLKDEDIEKLNGKMIHSTHFKEIVKHWIISIEDDGIIANPNWIGNVKYPFVKGLRFPNYQCLLEEMEQNIEAIDSYSIDTYLLNRLSSSIGKKRIRLTFRKKNAFARVDFEEMKTYGVIMPILFEVG